MSGDTQQPPPGSPAAPAEPVPPTPAESELVFQRTESTVPVQPVEGDLREGHVIASNVSLANETYVLLLAEGKTYALPSKLDLPKGSLVRATASALPDASLVWTFAVSDPKQGWAPVPEIREVTVTKRADYWVAEIQSAYLPRLETELRELVAKRKNHEVQWKKSFPRTPADLPTDQDATAFARAHLNCDEWEKARETLAARTVTRAEAILALGAHREIRKTVPRLGFTERLKWVRVYRQLRRREIAATAGVARAEAHLERLRQTLGPEPTPEIVARSAYGWRKVAEWMHADAMGVEAKAEGVTNDLEYGRILVRALKTMKEQPVTLEQSVKAGESAPRIPVLKDAEAFRLLRGHLVRVK